jgi:hypothetical protein
MNSRLGSNRRTFAIAGILATAGAFATIFFIMPSASGGSFGSLFEVPDYRLEVDPINTPGDTGSWSRIILSNTGRMALTNLTVSMDGNVIQTLDVLGPGETASISPDAEKLGAVTVTTSEGLSVTKEFRTPLGLPGHH